MIRDSFHETARQEAARSGHRRDRCDVRPQGLSGRDLLGRTLHLLWPSDHVSEAGEPGPDVTIEHILPRHHGGGDEVENLALACKPCNNEKGMRHDARRADDARTREVIARLQERRRERWREPALR